MQQKLKTLAIPFSGWIIGEQAAVQRDSADAGRGKPSSHRTTHKALRMSHSQS